MAATLSDVYAQARHTLLQVRDGLERLERLESSGQQQQQQPSPSFRGGVGVGQEGPLVVAPDLAQRVKNELGQLQVWSTEMDRLWRQIIPKGPRDLWKRKVEQVAEEVEALKAGLEKHQNRQRHRQIEAQERAELFRRTRGDGAQVLQVYDEEAQSMQSVRNSSRMLDDAFATGTAVLAQFAIQRDRLKQAQRKAYDVLNTVGLGNSVMRVIERRQLMDKWVAYVGMLVTIIIVIVFWRWTH
jgi:Golgi SNAP receptor complex protein 2